MRRALAATCGALLLAAAGATLLVSTDRASADPAPTDVVATPGVSVQIPETSASPTPGSGSGTGSGSGGGTGHAGGTGGGQTGDTGSGDTGSGSGSGQNGQPTATKFRLTIRPWRIHAGEVFTAEGAGYTPGEQVDFVLYPGAVAAGTFTADHAGKVVARATMSRKAAAGLYTVQATGRVSHRVAAATLAVAGAAQPQNEWWGLVIVGGGVVCAVGALVLALKLGSLGSAVLLGSPR